jgi:4-aminobutyrate aminotransferase/(S)-3-amino-2-methylpropionate transaminase
MTSTTPGSSRVRTAVPGPRSEALRRRRENTVASGVSSILPVYASQGGDGLLTDVDGNEFIDLGSGIAVTGVGNPAPKVAAAVGEQAARFTHTCFMVAPYEGYVDVCEQLGELTPGGHEKRSALFNSGAEAVETPSRSPGMPPAGRRWWFSTMLIMGART